MLRVTVALAWGFFSLNPNILHAQKSTEAGEAQSIDDRTTSTCGNPAEHFDEDVLLCVPNVCECNYGVAKTSCFTHEKEICESCHEKFELKNNACVKKVCTRGSLFMTYNYV